MHLFYIFHMLSIEESLVLNNNRNDVIFVIYILYCDLKTLYFYLASLWFGREYTAMERGRNLTEKFWEEII